MGMMTRRNVKGRAVKKTASANTLVEIKEGVSVNELIPDEEYTKTEINRMSTADLKELAKKENIDNAEDMTGAELKKVLIKHFNL